MRAVKTSKQRLKKNLGSKQIETVLTIKYNMFENVKLITFLLLVNIIKNKF